METNNHDLMQITHLHLVQISRITGAVPPPHTPLWREKDKFIIPTQKNTDCLLLASKKIGLDMSA
jgi:hypothetical protein